MPALAAIIPVTNGNNDGQGSLRFAIGMAQQGDQILFQGPIVVQLTATLVVDKSITITGVANAGITRAIGAPSFRMILIDNTTPRAGFVRIELLNFFGGQASTGAAIRNIYPFCEIINCQFYNNSGGAISLSTSGSTTINIQRCAFYNNSGTPLENTATGVTVEQCDFYGNTATGSGGAIRAAGGDLQLNRCTIRGNQAQSGGGISITNAQLQMTNCTITGNLTTVQGGGMAFGDGALVDVHSTTVTGNGSPSGGALYQSGTAALTATNTIWWGNSSSLVVVGGSATLSHCLVQGGFAGNKNIDENPLFVAPISANPVTPNPTGNFSLQACSPAINAGLAVGAPSVDISLASRPKLGAYDIGAYESSVLGSGAVVYVRTGASGTGTGQSWTDAFTSLQPALQLANQCGLVKEIWVAAGTYTPTTTTNRDLAFALKNNLAIYGGFAGSETALSQRNWRLNQTMLSGDIGAQGNRSDNAHNVISNNNNGLNATALLDGFIIRDGQANKAEYARSRGAGMFNLNSSPTIRNCLFVGNFSSEYGGAVFNQGAAATPTFINCVFSGNQASFGGGIYNESAQTQVINCTFSANQITGNGGGIYSYGTPKAVVRNSIVWGNANNGIFTAAIDNSTPVDVTHSIVQGGYNGTNNRDQDPRFHIQVPVGLGHLGNLRLLLCSPAINRGSNTALPAGITTDLAGFSRITLGPVDCGAYEYQTEPASNDIYIDATATNGTQEGTSWANAFTSLQAALNDMNLCALGQQLTLHIAAGTYVFPANVAAVADNLNGQILGGYPSGGGTRNPTANPVIVRGKVQVLKNVRIDGVRVEQAVN